MEPFFSEDSLKIIRRLLLHSPKTSFNSDTHQYFIDDIEVPGVNQVINEVIGEPWQVDQWYLDRGTEIHKAAPLIAAGKQFEFDPVIRAQVEALRLFFDEVVFPNDPEEGELHTEFQLFSSTFLFGGTLDLLLMPFSRRRILYDYKSGAIDMERLRLQLGGYSQLILENLRKKVDLGVGVRLKENRQYTLTAPINLRRARNEFLALNSTYKIKQRFRVIENA